jgi:type 1 fimbriae regulatory protein FimB
MSHVFSRSHGKAAVSRVGEIINMRQKDTPAMKERKHLTSLEVSKLIEAASTTRNTARDRCLVLLMFRHGLRVSEACAMQISQVDGESRILHVQRLKQGLSTTQPLRTDELRAIKAWLTRRGKFKAADTEKHFFLSERGQALSRKTVWAMLRGLAERAGLPIAAHPHMLRHACGYALADQGADTRLIQDYLGHRNIQHTVRYTATNPERFGKLWR